ncbi:MAG: hypothetical protein ACI8UO_004095 [Verrucomicrobiales bacterium]
MNPYEPHYREAEHRRLGVIEIQRLALRGVLKDPAAALEPQAGAEAQTRKLRLLFLIFGGMFLFASVVYFFAYNWAWLPAAARFAILEIGIVASVLGGLRVGFQTLGGQVLLLGASALTGVLCAIYGQVYQTGADAYEIFVWWAGLTLIWTLAARSAALWLLWFAVAQTAVSAFWYQSVLPAGAGETPTLYLILGLGSAGILVLREWIAGREGGEWLKSEWTRAVLVGAALYWLSAHPLMMIFERYGSWSEGPAFVINLIGTCCWGAALLIALWFFAVRRPSITALWVAMISACLVSTIYVGEKLVVDKDWDVFYVYWDLSYQLISTGLISAGLFGLSAFGLAIVRIRLIKFDRLPDNPDNLTLKKLQTNGIVDPKDRDFAVKTLLWGPGGGPLAWQTRLLSGFGMWIAGVLIAIGVHELVEFDTQSRDQKMMIAASIGLVAVLVGRFRPGWPVLDQFWLSVSMTGHLLLVFAWLPPTWDYASALLPAAISALIVYPLSQHAIQRYVSIALVWQLLTFHALRSHSLRHHEIPLDWWCAALVAPALGWILLLWTRKPFWRPAMFACVTGTLGAMTFAMGRPGVPWWLIALPGLIVGLGVAAHHFFNRLPGSSPQRGKLAGILALSGLATGPGIPVLLGMSALGVRRHDRFFLGLAAAFAPIFFLSFYQYLGLTLLTKSIILAICGAGALFASYQFRPASSNS